jgi:methylase of polypeptide subunit release factors
MKIYYKEWNFIANCIFFFFRIVHYLTNKIEKLLNKFRIKLVAKISVFHNLLFPYPHREDEKYCFAAGCDEDWKLLNLLKWITNDNKITIVSENVSSKYLKKFKIISYEDIIQNKFRTVVIPTKKAERIIEKKCRSIYQKHKYEFSLWDPHNYYLTSEIYYGLDNVEKDDFQVFTYRNIDLFVSPGNIVLPSYFANWGYINYLLSEIVEEGMNILDMWAGSGSIGFSLKKGKLIDISFAEINYFAVLGIKKTMENNQNLKGKVWLSDVFDSIPKSDKFDLIVGNPPCGRGSPLNFIQIGGADDKWESHLSFFRNAHKYLNKNGKICIVENISENKKHNFEFAESFYSTFNETFKELKLVEIRPLPGTFLSTLIIKRFVD